VTETASALRAAQTWFAQAVMTPESHDFSAATLEAHRRLTAGPRLDAGERLAIYRRAYHARLIECLADDYPTLQAAIGHDAFEALARAYVVEHPSMGPNLNSFGRHMAAFCAARDESVDGSSVPAEFAANLAALEWAIVEVIHAPSSAPLSLDALGQVPPEQWAGARLESTPALRIVRAAYPVNGYYQATRDENAPAIPGSAPSSTAVYRSGPTVWRMDLTPPMLELLVRLTSDECLSDALEGAIAMFGDVSEDVAAQRVMAWFREWVSSGLFSRVHL
jgi:hypothetical protein